MGLAPLELVLSTAPYSIKTAELGTGSRRAVAVFGRPAAR